MVLEKTPKSPLDSKEMKLVNLKRHQLWIFTGRMMLKMKLQYFGHLTRTAYSLEKTLMLGKIEGRRRGHQTTRWLHGITDAMDVEVTNSGKWWRTGMPGVLQSIESQRTGHNWVTEHTHTHTHTHTHCYRGRIIFVVHRYKRKYIVSDKIIWLSFNSKKQ